MDIQKDMIFLNVYFNWMTANNETNNIHNNNIQLVILFPIVPQRTNWKSVLVTTTNIRTSPISKDI